jgi:transposase-like protein
LPESYGVYGSTLGNWAKQDEIDRGVRDGVSTSDREEVTELRGENARLRIEGGLLDRGVAVWVRESNL